MFWFSRLSIDDGKWLEFVTYQQHSSRETVCVVDIIYGAKIANDFVDWENDKKMS